jgi:hypothetical protein
MELIHDSRELNIGVKLGVQDCNRTSTSLSSNWRIMSDTGNYRLNLSKQWNFWTFRGASHCGRRSRGRRFPLIKLQETKSLASRPLAQWPKFKGRRNLKCLFFEEGNGSVQDWSLQCPSNVMWPFKIYLSQIGPSKHSPELKMKTSLEVLNVIHMPQEPTSIRHCHSKKWS